MKSRIHAHARARLLERGATVAEALATIDGGERSSGRMWTSIFQRAFDTAGEWRGRCYWRKWLQVLALEDDGWLIVSVRVEHDFGEPARVRDEADV